MPCDRITPAAPLARWERVAALSLGALLGVAITILYVLHVSSTATMVEYVFKFLPVLTDGGFAAAFDGNALGDPRPRIVTTLLTYVNILLRRALLSLGPIHPSLGIAWALYPLALILIHRVVERLTLDRRAALLSVILLGSSPALLDTLANYYVPAKPIANIMLLSAILGSCLVFPAPGDARPARPVVGSALVFAAGLLGLLADETAVFIYLCVPLIFIDRARDRRIAPAVKTLYAASFAASLLAYFAIALVVVPAVNLALGQVPVDLRTVIFQGVYDEMFLSSTKPVTGLLAETSPGSLLQTIISVHTVPHRFVGHRWTSGTPLPRFWQWRLSDQIGLYFFLAIFVSLALAARRDPIRRRLVIRLWISFAVFVLVESVLILRLSPWIVEANYYAAFSSIFFAMILALMLSGWRAEERQSLALVWLTVAYLASVQFLNFYETAQRHPSIGEPRLNWVTLRQVHQRVAEGDFAGVARDYPFPSQLFSYGFEHAAAIEHAHGRKVDLQPMQHPPSTLFKFIGVDKLQDPNITNADLPRATDEAAITAAGAVPVILDGLASELRGRGVRGRSGTWGYVRRFLPSGEVRERIWREGMMRVWSDRGTLVRDADGLCVNYASRPPECIARAYRRDGITYGIDAGGRVVTTFTEIDLPYKLPCDLRAE